MHNIQPRAGDNIKDFTAINMWYQRLDERYNFSLGPNILPLMTTGNLNKIITLNPPFLQYNVDYQQKYMSSVFGMIYQSIISFRVILFSFSGENQTQVSHPPHLTSSWSSSFIPFCAFKTDLNFSGNSILIGIFGIYTINKYEVSVEQNGHTRHTRPTQTKGFSS